MTGLVLMAKLCRSHEVKAFEMVEASRSWSLPGGGSVEAVGWLRHAGKSWRVELASVSFVGAVGLALAKFLYH